MRFAILALALALALPAFADAAVPREERREYTGSFTVTASSSCSDDDFGFACFRLDGSESVFSATVTDVTELPVPFLYSFGGAPGGEIVCATHVEDIAIPEGAYTLSIMIFGAPWAQYFCPGMSGGVAGEVVAQFS